MTISFSRFNPFETIVPHFMVWLFVQIVVTFSPMCIVFRDNTFHSNKEAIRENILVANLNNNCDHLQMLGWWSKRELVLVFGKMNLTVGVSPQRAYQGYRIH